MNFLISKLKTFTRRSIIVMMLMISGCGLFGANSPTDRDIAVSVFNGMTEVLSTLDTYLANYLESHDLTEEELVKAQACVERLHRVRDSLVLAKEYIEDRAAFKTTIMFAAEEAKILVVELRELGVKVPKMVDTIIMATIAYAGG